MSKFYIEDLESIKNGNDVKLNFGYRTNDLEINLFKLHKQIEDLRRIRYLILEQFKSDVAEEFERVRGSKIDTIKKIEFDPRNLFFSKYLDCTIPTMFGDTRCIVSEDGLNSASFETSEIENDISLILPYIRGILNVKNKTNVLNNEFYNGIELFNEIKEKVLNVNGDGILLPFNDYDDLTEEEKQELLSYYYSNYNQILKNMFISDSSILNMFRTNASTQKVLALYREGQNN
ncbi:MAG: hypothetical protein IJ068_04890 [Bacilli bacterium]|nr:hypothetical protein [Bacilli bacterium]